MGFVEPIGIYEDLTTNHEVYDVAGSEVKTIGLDGLICPRRHVFRSKAKASLAQLRAIKQLREEKEAEERDSV